MYDNIYMTNIYMPSRDIKTPYSGGLPAPRRTGHVTLYSQSSFEPTVRKQPTRRVEIFKKALLLH